MKGDSGNIRARHIFLFIFVFAAIGVGGYLFYDYERIKAINATVVTPADAKAILQQALQNG